MEKPQTKGQEKVLWQLEGHQAVAQGCDAVSAWYEPLADHGHWLAASAFPKLQFNLEGERTIEKGSRFMVRITVRIAESVEYVLAQQRYLSRLRQHEQQEDDLKRSLHHLESARRELADIKAGKPFRLGMKIFSILGFLKR